MATTHFMARSLLTTTTKRSSAAAFCRSYTSLSLSTSRSSPLPTNFPLLRLRYLSAANLRLLTPAHSTTVRAFATRQTSSSLNDPNPNWSNRPPKETILLDGCDFEHWLVVMEKPEGDPTRDEIIDSYIKTLATVVGSEEEARMKVYSVSTRHYFAFGALVSEELSYKLKDLPRVRWVLPDSYLDVKNKDYGGEPFINGQAVPYDPKYHEEWVRNNARANERNRRNDRPRNFDRSRNFERRREMQQGPPSNMVRPNPGPNMTGGPPGNPGSPYPVHNVAGGPPSNMVRPNPGPNMTGGPPGNPGSPYPAPNMGGGPPRGMGEPPNTGGASNAGGMLPNMSGGQPSNMGVSANYRGGVPPNNMGGVPSNGSMGYQSGPGPNQSSFAPNAAGNPYPNQNMPYQSGPSPNQSSYGTNTASGNPYPDQTMHGRDMPPPPNYR